MSVWKGDIAELEFEVQATRRKLVVSRPVITHDYDRIVDNGKKRLRIQIKSTFTEGPNYGLNIAKGMTNKKTYTREEIDFIVCFINELKSWYIFPIEVVEGLQKVTVSPDSVESKWNKYRDSWGSLLN